MLWDIYIVSRTNALYKLEYKIILLPISNYHMLGNNYFLIIN